jgi:hypothetical protein
MRSQDEPPGLIAILGPPTLAVASAILLHVMPSHLLTLLVAWILASFQVGVLIGHCVLNEE